VSALFGALAALLFLALLWGVVVKVTVRMVLTELRLAREKEAKAAAKGEGAAK